MTQVFAENGIHNKLRSSEIPDLIIADFDVSDTSSKKLTALKKMHNTLMKSKFDETKVDLHAFKSQLRHLKEVVLETAKTKYLDDLEQEILDRKIQKALKRFYTNLPTKKAVANLTNGRVKELIGMNLEIMKSIINNPDITKKMSTRDLSRIDPVTLEDLQKFKKRQLVDLQTVLKSFVGNNPSNLPIEKIEGLVNDAIELGESDMRGHHNLDSQKVIDAISNILSKIPLTNFEQLTQKQVDDLKKDLVNLAN